MASASAIEKAAVLHAAYEGWSGRAEQAHSHTSVLRGLRRPSEQQEDLVPPVVQTDQASRWVHGSCALMELLPRVGGFAWVQSGSDALPDRAAASHEALGRAAQPLALCCPPAGRRDAVAIATPTSHVRVRLVGASLAPSPAPPAQLGAYVAGVVEAFAKCPVTSMAVPEGLVDAVRWVQSRMKLVFGRTGGVRNVAVEWSSQVTRGGSGRWRLRRLQSRMRLLVKRSAR